MTVGINPPTGDEAETITVSDLVKLAYSLSTTNVNAALMEAYSPCSFMAWATNANTDSLDAAFGKRNENDTFFLGKQLCMYSKFKGENLSLPTISSKSTLAQVFTAPTGGDIRKSKAICDLMEASPYIASGPYFKKVMPKTSTEVNKLYVALGGGYRHSATGVKPGLQVSSLILPASAYFGPANAALGFAAEKGTAGTISVSQSGTTLASAGIDSSNGSAFMRLYRGFVKGGGSFTVSGINNKVSYVGYYLLGDLAANTDFSSATDPAAGDIPYFVLPVNSTTTGVNISFSLPKRGTYNIECVGSQYSSSNGTVSCTITVSIKGVSIGSAIGNYDSNRPLTVNNVTIETADIIKLTASGYFGGGFLVFKANKGYEYPI